jgi:hypothetical protein
VSFRVIVIVYTIIFQILTAIMPSDVFQISLV